MHPPPVCTFSFVCSPKNKGFQGRALCGLTPGRREGGCACPAVTCRQTRPCGVCLPEVTQGDYVNEDKGKAISPKLFWNLLKSLDLCAMLTLPHNHV